MLKRSMVAGLVLVLAVAAVPSIGQAQFFPAQKLKDTCLKGQRDKSNYVAEWACSGFIIGVSDSAFVRKVVCLPNGATIGQVVDIVKKYLNDHPEDGHYSAASVVENALRANWPCK